MVKRPHGKIAGYHTLKMASVVKCNLTMITSRGKATLKLDQDMLKGKKINKDEKYILNHSKYLILKFAITS